MQLTWLHVSDFHFRSGDPYERDVVLRALVDSVQDMREQGRAVDLIFATGDIAFSGKPAEYELATPFFDALLKAAGLERRHLFVIPGNHDVDRMRGLGLARTLGSREEADSYFAPEVPKLQLTQKLGAFADWYDSYFEGIRVLPRSTTCGPVEAVEVRGITIGVLPINSALFCLDDEDYAKLWIGRRCLDPALDELRRLSSDLRVALVHHPLDWLSDHERSNIKTDLHGGVDVMLRGHLHETDVEGVVSSAGSCLHVAAGAAYQTLKWPNRAVYATFVGKDVSLYPIRYEDQPQEVWTVDPSLFPRDPGFTRAFQIPRFTAEPAASPTTPNPAPAVSTAPGRFRSNVPPRHNLPFVGREVHLDRMLASLGDPLIEAAMVLHGHSGVGKSELAREFARLQRNRYPGGTFFISTGGGAELVDLARIGANVLELDFPHDLSLQDQCERTLLSLGAAPVLLIYDNAADAEAVGRWLPPAGMPCHVLVTSVSDRWGPTWQLLEVEPLPDESSLELVQRVGGTEVAERYGEELVFMAGGLPIQLCSSAAMVAYEARRGRLDSVELRMAPEAHESFRLVYERLESAPRLLLLAAAGLNTQRIPRDELAQLLTDSADWSESDFRRILDACLDLHLLEGSSELRMHQLFASFLKQVPLAPEEVLRLEQIRGRQRERLVELAVEVAASPASRALSARMMAFLVEQDEGELQSAFSTTDSAAIGYALSQIGEFGAARVWYERVAKEGQQQDVHRNMDYSMLSSSLHQVGYCLSSEGKFKEARPWFERAVDVAKQGEANGSLDHESLGSSLHQIGLCLSREGRFKEARKWYERAVAERQLGNVNGRIDHMSVGSSLHQLGYCLSATGKYKEARSQYERAVEEKQQGDVNGLVIHDSLGASLHQVGYCLSSEGRLKEAQPWFERAGEETRQGDLHGRVNHKSVGVSLHQVGYCLSRGGEFKEALPWFERAAEEAQQGDVHGRVDHESLASSLHEVGYCLVSIGKYEEAREWFERSVAESRQGDVHGRVDHTSLGVSMDQIGYCLMKAENFKEACLWYEDAVVEKRQGDVFGRTDHSNLGISLHQLGFCLTKERKDDEAILWFEQAVEAKRLGDVFGRVDRQSLMRSILEGVACLRRSGRDSDAMNWEAQALALQSGEDADVRL